MVKTQIQVKAQISNKEIWSIALPIMLGNMAQTIINFTDTAFLGHVGVIALGASMLAGLFYLLFTTVAAGFAIGIQIIVARRFGEKNYGRIGVIFEHGSLFILLLGLILFSVLYFCSDQLLLLLIDSPNLYDASVEYIRYRQFGILIFQKTADIFHRVIGLDFLKGYVPHLVVMAHIADFPHQFVFFHISLPAQWPRRPPDPQRSACQR